MPIEHRLTLVRVFQLRLVIARFGEMDIARWWNTKGQLGRHGATVLRRGFPRTHYFAQARAVFTVAAQRCTEVFDITGCATLWKLPERIEEELEAVWETWIEDAREWTPFFEKLQALDGTDLAETLRNHDLVNDHDLEAYSKLRRSSEGRAVPIPGVFNGTDADVALLALGFGRGEQGAVAVPYVRRGDV